ncbi:helix-turn-helix domain-containing protein [Streptomyces purpurascens]|uniref:Winged helix-turn-helix domain-containing protein n=1 Tax=Streptomyces purpurascens TaxID=1924 RepID=A0ABZ1MGL1_STREF
MALRIHFTDDDLTRIRFAQAPDPMWEALQSMHMLQTRDGWAVFGRWRARVRPALGAPERQLLRLAPPVGYSPDFLTPAAGEGGLEPGIDALLSTPRARLRHDLLELSADGRRLPPWGRALADGDGAAVHHLGRTLRTYVRAGLAPYWDHVRARFEAERALRTRTPGAGAGSLLGALHPELHWRPPVLTVGGLRVERDVHLRGRGLLVLPSYFCWRYPTVLKDAALPPVVVYPMTHQGALNPADRSAGDTRAPSRSLVALLGRTRAEILRHASENGATTTELAHGTGVSAATASYHASVLRDAGLLSTHRLGNAVLHTTTPLGAALLDGRHGSAV